MIRTKKPTEISSDKKKVQQIVDSLSKGWLSDERETSILFDHSSKEVFLETSHPATARSWFDLFWGDDEVKFDENSATLKVRIPWKYCRKAELIVKPNYR